MNAYLARRLVITIVALCCFNAPREVLLNMVDGWFGAIFGLLTSIIVWKFTIKVWDWTAIPIYQKER